MDKQKVYYASKIGTFELDAITGLIPNPPPQGPVRSSDPGKPVEWGMRVIMGASSDWLVFASEEDRDAWRTRIEQEMGIVHDVSPALDGLDMGPPLPTIFATAVPEGVPVGAQGISGVEMAAQLRHAAPQSVARPVDIAQAVVASVPDDGFVKQVELGTNGMTQGGPETAEPDPARKRQLGYCVMAGCMTSAVLPGVLCDAHAGILDTNDEPPLCRMVGCGNTPGQGSIVCQEHADTLNNLGRVDAG